MNKNWFDPEEVKWQAEQPDGWVSVEDFQREALLEGWKRLAEFAPMFTVLSYELLEQLRQKLFNEQ